MIVQERPAWFENAACKNTPVRIMVPDHCSPLNVLPAKRICRGCPVKAPCLAYALETETTGGVYGGLSPRERSRLQR